MSPSGSCTQEDAPISRRIRACRHVLTAVRSHGRCRSEAGTAAIGPLWHRGYGPFGLQTTLPGDGVGPNMAATDPEGKRARASETGGKMTKRSVVIAGHRTSVSLEAPFWHLLGRIAEERGISVNRLVGEVDAGRRGNLSSTLRLFVLHWLAARASIEIPSGS